MPFNGLTSFLRGDKIAKVCNISVCQCPSTGLHHFYNSHSYCKYDNTTSVSMPFNGLTSFLQALNPLYNFLMKLCQCPSTGLHHFYMSCRKPLKHWPWKDVSMPFNGLTSFLRMSCLSCWTQWLTVSMPFNGLTSFLQQPQLLQIWQHHKCVNALQRAYIISTSP